MSTTTSPVAGKIGGALNFDGATNFLESDWESNQIQVGDVSMSAWIYIPVTYTSASALETIVDSGDIPANNDVVLSLGPQGAASDGKLHFDLWQTSPDAFQRTSSSKSTWAPGWYFVAGIFASSTGITQVYINGVPDGPSSSGGNRGTIAFSKHLTIGTDPFYAFFFKGKLDDVRVYNRALSPQEIALAYAVGTANIEHAPAPTTPNGAPLSSGLVAYWPLDGNTTNWRTGTTRDISGKGNTGTLESLSTTTTPVAGKIGGAFNFTGISTADVNFSTLNGDPTLQETYSLWFKTSAALGFERVLFTRSWNPYNKISIFPDHLVYTVNTDAGVNDLSSTGFTPDAKSGKMASRDGHL